MLKRLEASVPIPVSLSSRTVVAVAELVLEVRLPAAVSSMVPVPPTLRFSSSVRVPASASWATASTERVPPSPAETVAPVPPRVRLPPWRSQTSPEVDSAVSAPSDVTRIGSASTPMPAAERLSEPVPLELSQSVPPADQVMAPSLARTSSAMSVAPEKEPATSISAVRVSSPITRVSAVRLAVIPSMRLSFALACVSLSPSNSMARSVE